MSTVSIFNFRIRLFTPLYCLNTHHSFLFTLKRCFLIYQRFNCRNIVYTLTKHIPSCYTYSVQNFFKRYLTFDFLFRPETEQDNGHLTPEPKMMKSLSTRGPIAAVVQKKNLLEAFFQSQYSLPVVSGCPRYNRSTYQYGIPKFVQENRS